MGCDESLWGSWLDMFVWGVLLVGVHVSGGVVVGEVWCEFFYLSMTGLSLGMFVGICFPGGVLFRVVSPFVSGMWIELGRLRSCFFVSFLADVLGPLLYAGCVVAVGAFC